MRISDWSSDVCSCDLLAHSGDLSGALKAYDAALALAPDNTDAKRNRDLVEKMLKQQQQKNSAQSEQQNKRQDPKDSQAQDQQQPSSNGQKQSDQRSEERSVGKECVSTCRTRGSTYHKKKQKKY